jgi:hypothetical protein
MYVHGLPKPKPRQRKIVNVCMRTSLVDRVNRQAMSEVETFWIDIQGTTLHQFPHRCCHYLRQPSVVPRMIFHLALTLFLPLPTCIITHLHARLPPSFLLQESQPFSPRFVKSLVMTCHPLKPGWHSPPKRFLSAVAQAPAAELLVLIFASLSGGCVLFPPPAGSTCGCALAPTARYNNLP